MMDRWIDGFDTKENAIKKINTNERQKKRCNKIMFCVRLNKIESGIQQPPKIIYHLLTPINCLTNV